MPPIVNFADLSLGDTLPSFSFDVDLPEGETIERAMVCMQSETERLVYQWRSPISISIIGGKLTMTAVKDTRAWPAGDMKYVTELIMGSGFRRTFNTGSMKIIRQPA